MFSITHVWFAGKVLGEQNHQIALGSIFPDMVISGCLKYPETHKGGWALYHYIKEEHPQFLPFVKGMLTHGVDPKGLDYFGDEKYKELEWGYCFEKAGTIKDIVVKNCNIPEEYGLWKAHNFIEMAIELEVNKAYPETLEQMKAALFDRELHREIGEVLDTFYDQEKGTVEGMIGRFSTFLELKEPNSEALAIKYDLQMKQRHDISINVIGCGEIIENCRTLIKEDLFDFFMEVENAVRHMIIREEE